MFCRSELPLRHHSQAVLVTLGTLFFLVLSPATTPRLAAEPLSYYLPEGTLYDGEIPTPRQIFGWHVGEWHVRHDQLVRYMEVLAENSPRVQLETIGRTHEQRPLVQLVISSPRNLERLEEVLATHRDLANPETPRPDTDDLPLVVNLGYSIHGNEPSGSNAAPVVAYHLAAGRGDAMEELLDRLIIVLDPSLNPDGLSRFAHWANNHRGQVLVADPQHREHREGWPNGRTNHYWFDLNRDWLLAQHPESQARLKSFHRFHPNLLTDFHEMGTDSTYFFQPGVPSRQNPLTPVRNLEITQAIAHHHARALEAIGSLFFTEELFDDYYYGKGSTYPDLQGSVGILFEQASSRGHLQESRNGPVSFPFTIRNQVRTSLSSLAGALDQRDALLDYRAEFFATARDLASKSPVAAHVFGDPRDLPRTLQMVQLLRRHQIEVHRLAREVMVEGKKFPAETSFVVPVAQPQSRLVQSLFERRVEFEEKTFYDVSTWNMPLAFGLATEALPSKVDLQPLLGDPIDEVTFPAGSLPPDRSVDVAAPEPAFAYLFEWHGYYAPRALHRLLEAGVQARVATRPFRAITRRGERDFDRGTIVVPLGIQSLPAVAWPGILRTLTTKDGVDVYATDHGLTPQGLDLGSPSLRPLKSVRPALLVGPGVSAYEAGEIWHLLDHRFGIGLSLLRRENLGNLDLDRYTHLVMVDGSYPMPPNETAKIKSWVEEGGVLVTTQRASRWATEHLMTQAPSNPPTPSASSKTPDRKPYGDHERDRAEALISGTIFEADLDLTHPLAFGYSSDKLPFFRHHRVILSPDEDPYATVAAYTDSPLLSGYVSPENLDRLRGTPALLVHRLQRGTVVRMVDDPNFRSYWYGTNKLLLNALFFAKTVRDTTN